FPIVVPVAHRVRQLLAIPLLLLDPHPHCICCDPCSLGQLHHPCWTALKAPSLYRAGLHRPPRSHHPLWHGRRPAACEPRSI
ncbi:hypothetical protein DFQ26_008912, partial [Actinomortierella ambigua]